ncbi:hypothetical protein LSH36_9g13031 [Paralvinella palmiformis]|uniref:Diacylglycerol O-acyltransferase n=1 Tax=Paralvinella palmiformis TaxID=53620 RepID=A0AAD9NJJ8_9ANNE|nr:hypothetical protein LSH36_9g13031 [Paralvinella palmiformis]
MSSSNTELSNLITGGCMVELKLEMSPRECDVAEVRTATPSEVEAQTDVDTSGTGAPQTIQNGGYPSYQLRSAPYKRIQHPVDKSLFVSFIGSIFFLLISLVLFCPGLVVYLVLLPIGYFIKKSLALCCCCCCCSENRFCTSCDTEYMSQSDAFWLHSDPLNVAVYQALFVLEKGLDASSIRTLLNTRLVGAEDKNHRKLYPRFSQRIIRLYSGYAWIKDGRFSIDNHVISMPDTIVNQETLTEHVGQLAGKALSLDKPLWEIHVRTNYGVDQDTVILFRIHPCLSDGVSLVRLLFKSLISDWRDNGSLSLKPRFGHVAFAFNCMRAVFSGPVVLLRKWLFVWQDYNLVHVPRLSGRKVVAWSEPYNMAKADRIKNVTRSTLNDVLLAVTSGILRTYFQKHGVAHPFDINAFIPVDFQTDGSCAVDMHNRYALVDVPLPTNTEGTIPRLWEVRHHMDVLKNSADSVVLYGCVRLLGYLMPENLYHKVWQRIYSKASCFVTSLQGPDTELTFCSCVIKNMVSWMPTRANVALSISFLSYADQLRMSVIADSAVITEPQILTNDFVAEVRRQQ